MNYILAIDETGNFYPLEDSKITSFACGVLLNVNEQELEQCFKNVYEKLESKTAEDLAKRDILNSGTFHYSQAKVKYDNYKEIISGQFLRIVNGNVFKSVGKPLLSPNNQSFWQAAVISVIKGVIESNRLPLGTTLKVYYDNRKSNVWGLYNKNPTDSSNQDTMWEVDSEFFRQYHNFISNQILRFIKPFADNKGIKVEVIALSDSNSYHIALADLVCGLVRDKSIPNVIECPCYKLYDGDENPFDLIATNPEGALAAFVQQLSPESNIEDFVSRLFNSIRSDQTRFVAVWEMFHFYIKTRIARRDQEGLQSELTKLVNEFKGKFNHYAVNNGSSTVQSVFIPGELRLELLTAFIEYESHRGEHKLPFEHNFAEEIFAGSHKDVTRITRIWERKISYYLRAAQINFNGYNFEQDLDIVRNLAKDHKAVVELLFPDTQKDENAAALYGTVGQYYAFRGDLETAIENFNTSLGLAIKHNSIAQSNSYLLTCAFLKEDLDQAHMFFEAQTGRKPEMYALHPDANGWNLLSYFKLRALELKLNNSTRLSHIDLDGVSDKRFYPYPLVFKWAAIGLYLEQNKTAFEKINNCLLNAVESLIDEDNGFAIRTLALPIIQVWGLINNQNPYHSRYNNLVNNLRTECSKFDNYVKQHQVLSSISNNYNLWQRAVSLPFNYS